MKKTNKLRVLVIGSSGFIGKNIFNYLNKNKIRVVGTFFKNKRKNANLIKFNILKDKVKKLENFKNISHVIIASGGQKKLDDVEKNYNYEKEVGYNKIKKILDWCNSQNIKIIYISSDAVFDGKKGNYSEKSKTNPINKYGKIKNLTETYIKKKINNYLIIRVSKVLSLKQNDNNIFNEIIVNLRNCKYKFAYDEIFTPIFISDLCKGVYNLIKKDLNGIFHLKSLSKTSRYILAKKICKSLNLKNKIYKTSIRNLKLKALRGINLSLNTKKYDNIFNISKKELDFYIKRKK